jgi:hypothetical protein
VARLAAARREVAVQVLAWTSVARVVSGVTGTAPITTREGDDIDISGHQGSPGIALAAAALTVYDRGLRGFPPFRQAVDPAWPLSCVRPGQGLRTPVIDIVYPDRSPARLPFVEPAAPTTGRPRIRLQRGNVDPEGQPLDLAVLAHELAHALHFSLMPVRLRLILESRYAAWIGARIATGRDPTHAAERRTTPFVAWLEAFGLFAERYDRFVGAAAAPPAGQATFVATEIDRWQHLIEAPNPAVEASVYASSILLPAREHSLDAAVGDYLASARTGVLEQSDFEASRRLRR